MKSYRVCGFSGRLDSISRTRKRSVVVNAFGGLLIAFGLCSMWRPAFAVPVLYSILFDASNVSAGALGPSGTGSFVYDAELDGGIMTGLNWDFGSGRTGGVTDAQLASRFATDPTEGHFIFANIFDHTHLDEGAYGGSVGYSPFNANQLYGSFPGSAQRGWEAGEVNFCYLSYAVWPHDSCLSQPLVRTMDAGEYSIRFLNQNQNFETWRGLVHISVVPIPATAWLFSSAIGLFGWLRRKTAE